MQPIPKNQHKQQTTEVNFEGMLPDKNLNDKLQMEEIKIKSRIIDLKFNFIRYKKTYIDSHSL